MPVIVVTVTVDSVVPTSTDSSSSSAGSALSSGTIGIIVGSVSGGVLFIGLLLYLLNRRRRRVANPTHGPSTGSRKKKAFLGHSQRPSVSTEPLMSQVPWPTHASTSQVHSQNAASPRSDSISPGLRDSQYSLHEIDLAEINQVVEAETITHSATPTILSIPPVRKPDPGSSNPSRQPSDVANAADGISPNPQQSLLLARMLQSRAQASEVVAPSPGGYSVVTDSPDTLVDFDALLADALRDAEASLRDANQGEGEEEDGEDDDRETESMYSQLSAPLDHAVYFADPLSRKNSVKSSLRKNSSQRPRRLPPLPTVLPLVTEVPDTPRTSEIASSQSAPTGVNSSQEAHGSHGTRSCAPSSVDQSASFPLLTSVGFGKNNSTSAGSSSNAGGGGSNSSSSGGASRRPLLAPSGARQNLGSGSRSEGTDGHLVTSQL